MTTTSDARKRMAETEALVPSTEEIRYRVEHDWEPYGDGSFNAWLTVHDTAVRGEALRNSDYGEGWEEGAKAIAEKIAVAIEGPLRRLDRIAQRVEHVPFGTKCVECGHSSSRHNELAYCQVGECSCETGTPITSEAIFIRRELHRIARAVGVDES